MMCSQLADALADSLCERNSLPQYTQALSLSRTSFSSSAGIFQLFAIVDLGAFTHNVWLRGRLKPVPVSEANDLSQLLALIYILGVRRFEKICREGKIILCECFG